MKIILLENQDALKERIFKFFSEKGMELNKDSDKNLSYHESSANLEDFLKETNLDNLLEGKNISAKDQIVFFINNNENKKTESKIEYKNISVDIQYKEAYINTKRLALTSFEYKLLVFFMSNQRKLIAKKSLMNFLWGENHTHQDPDNALYTHIKNLKKKLVAGGVHNYIHTVYNEGYRFEDEENI